MKMKKSLAILLALSMVVGTISYYPTGNTAVANDAVSAPETEDYTHWTFTDVGHTDGTYQYQAPAVVDSTEQMDLQHSVLSGYVKFSSAASSGMLMQNYGMASICVGVDSTNDIWSSRYI